MENHNDLVHSLIEKAEHYGKTTMELYHLKAIDKSAEVVSSLASHLVVMTVLSFFLLILNVGVAMWVGEMLGKTYYGFFLVAGFYALLGTALYVFREQWLKAPISNSIITQALK